MYGEAWLAEAGSESGGGGSQRWAQCGGAAHQRRTPVGVRLDGMGTPAGALQLCPPCLAADDTAVTFVQHALLASFLLPDSAGQQAPAFSILVVPV